MLLATIGYQGATLESFLTTLEAAHIAVVVDVRARPLSRKRGFSKQALCSHLEARGIAYRHASALGCPQEIREQYRRGGDWERYRNGYLAYLAHQDEALVGLADLVGRVRSCLVCFEADPAACHRSLVADAVAQMASNPTPIRHLVVNGGTTSSGKDGTPAAGRSGSPRSTREDARGPCP